MAATSSLDGYIHGQLSQGLLLCRRLCSSATPWHLPGYASTLLPYPRWKEPPVDKLVNMFMFFRIGMRRSGGTGTLTIMYLKIKACYSRSCHCVGVKGELVPKIAYMPVLLTIIAWSNALCPSLDSHILLCIELKYSTASFHSSSSTHITSNS
eukprot:Gb_12571 [translate_table: standard]